MARKVAGGDTARGERGERPSLAGFTYLGKQPSNTRQSEMNPVFPA